MDAALSRLGFEATGLSLDAPFERIPLIGARNSNDDDLVSVISYVEKRRAVEQRS